MHADVMFRLSGTRMPGGRADVLKRRYCPAYLLIF